MATSSYANNTFVSIEGEFAEVGGPSIVDSTNLELSVYPEEALLLPEGAVLPSLPAGQITMLKTILTANGRNDLFVNPLQADIDAVSKSLKSLGGIPGFSSANTGMMQSLLSLKDHTDRLTGVVEPDANSAALPTLEKSISVGSSLTRFSQILDGRTDNLPSLMMFGSLFAGAKLLTSLKDELAKPHSAISLNNLTTIENSIAKSVSDDINNYFIGVKKLKRMGVASMVYGTAGNQVEKTLVELIGTDVTKESVLEVQTPANTATTSSGGSSLTTGTNHGSGSLLVNYVFDMSKSLNSFGKPTPIKLVGNGLDSIVFELPLDANPKYSKGTFSVAPGPGCSKNIGWTFWFSETPDGLPIGGMVNENFGKSIVTCGALGGILSFSTKTENSTTTRLTAGKSVYVVVKCSGRLDVAADSFSLFNATLIQHA